MANPSDQQMRDRPYNHYPGSEIGPGTIPKDLIAQAVQATYDAHLADGTFPQLLDTLREAVWRDMALDTRHSTKPTARQP